MKPSRRMTRPSLGGMLATRPGALVLAVLCAACAAGVIVFALTSYKASVKPIVSQATVLVATGEISKGTSGTLIASEQLYKSTPIVASQLVPGAVSDASTLQGKVAAADILPGQQLTSADFGTTIGVATQLAPNQRAISLTTDEVHGDLAAIVPGDHVDMYAALSATDSASGKSTTFVSMEASNVLVLKTPASGLAGASGSSGSAAPVAGTALVVAVPTTEIQGLALTADGGHIWVVLRPPNATAPVGGYATADSILAQAIAAAPGTPSNLDVGIAGKRK